MDKARERLLEELGRGQDPIIDVRGTRQAHEGTAFSRDYTLEARHVTAGRDRLPEYMAAATDALLLRCAIPIKDPHPAARDLRRTSLVNMADTILRQRGVNTTAWNESQIVARAMSTSDFSLLLANTAGKALVSGFEMEPGTHTRWTRAADIRDFKPVSRVKLSETPELEEQMEGGELIYGGLSERAESYQLRTYSKGLSLTRQSIINDDLGGFTRLAGAFGASARRKEADLTYAILTANGNMSDGVALFHANHGNLATSGSALSATSLSAARAAMRGQKGPNGGYLDPTPRFLIVPVALQTAAEVLIASTTIQVATGQENQTPAWIRSLEVIADPRLDADSTTAWYLAASPSSTDTIERGYLDGVAAPYTEEQWDFDRDVYKLKVRHDFAAAAVDWVSLYKATGAA